MPWEGARDGAEIERLPGQQRARVQQPHWLVQTATLRLTTHVTSCRSTKALRTSEIWMMATSSFIHNEYCPTYKLWMPSTQGLKQNGIR